MAETKEEILKRLRDIDFNDEGLNVSIELLKVFWKMDLPKDLTLLDKVIEEKTIERQGKSM